MAAFNATFLLSYLVVLDLWIFAGSDGETPNSNSKLGTEYVVREPPSPQFLGLSKIFGYGWRGERGGPQVGGVVGAGGNSSGGRDLSVSNNPPELLAAINRGSLSVFLLVCPSFMLFCPRYVPDVRGILSGECCDWCHQHDSVDDVHVRYEGDADFGVVFTCCVLCALAGGLFGERSLAAIVAVGA